MGTGQTGIACKKLKRNFIGIELDDNAFKLSEKRIKETILI
jgi:site-specific DNA-methyltransferase (adenine-specific)